MVPKTKRIIFGLAAAIIVIYVLVYFLDSQTFNAMVPFIDTDPSDCCVNNPEELN